MDYMRVWNAPPVGYLYTTPHLRALAINGVEHVRIQCLYWMSDRIDCKTDLDIENLHGVVEATCAHARDGPVARLDTITSVCIERTIVALRCSPVLKLSIVKYR